MAKRIISFAVSLGILLTVFSAVTLTAHASTYIVNSDSEINQLLDAIDRQNFTGSGTTAAKAKEVIRHFIKSSSFRNNFPYPNSGSLVTYVTDGVYAQNIFASKGCAAYCYYMERNVYGREGGRRDQRVHTAATLKALLQTYGQAGDHIRISPGNAVIEHSLTFISSTDSGFYTLEYMTPKIYLTYWTYSDFIIRCGGNVSWLYDTNTASNSATINPPPNYVLSVSAAKGADASQVKLSWTTIPGASYYKVYYKRGDGTKEGWDSTNVTGTSFTSLGNDTKQSYYTFTVYAVNSSGGTIASGSVRYDMPKTPIVTPVLSVSAAQGADTSQVKLSWTTIPSASYYKVYYKRGDGTKEGWDSTSVTGTSFTSLGNDTKQSYYTFTVYAVNASGSTITSGSVKYDMPKTAIVTPVLSVSAAQGADTSQVKLSWTTIPGASYYKVYYKRGDGTKEGWDSTSVTGTSFTSLGNDTKQSYYTFTVYAVNASGGTITSGSVRYDMPKTATVTPVLSVSAAKGADSSQVKLSWTTIPGTSYYKVYYKRGDGTKEGWDSTYVTGTSFTSLGNDTKQSYYTFTVYAVNASGGTITSGSVRYDMR